MHEEIISQFRQRITSIVSDLNDYLDINCGYQDAALFTARDHLFNAMNDIDSTHPKNFVTMVKDQRSEDDEGNRLRNR